MAKNKGIVKILWYFVVFLDFFFCLVKFGEQKFTVSLKIFFYWFFYFIFKMHSLKWLSQLKTNNNLPFRICCENVMDIALLQNKIIKYHTGPTITKIKVLRKYHDIYCIPELFIYFLANLLSQNLLFYRQLSWVFLTHCLK